MAPPATSSQPITCRVARGGWKLQTSCKSILVGRVYGWGSPLRMTHLMNCRVWYNNNTQSPLLMLYTNTLIRRLAHLMTWAISCHRTRATSSKHNELGSVPLCTLDTYPVIYIPDSIMQCTLQVLRLELQLLQGTALCSSSTRYSQV